MNDRLPGLPPYDAPALPSQVSSLLIFGTPDMWFNRMCELNDVVIKHVEDFGAKIQAKINSLSEWDAAIIGGTIGLGVGGPLGGLVGGLTGAALIGTVKDWLNGKLGDLLREIWDAHKLLVDAMQAGVDAIWGNPEKLRGLGAGYQTAMSKLNGSYSDVKSATDDVSIFWGGRGQEAYANAAGQQMSAMEAMAGKMGTANHLMADAAEMIQQCWSDIIQALIALGADLLSTVGDEVHITKLPTLKVTATCKVISNCVNFLNAVITAIRNVNITARNTSMMEWTDLTAGEMALDDNSWPAPSSMASSQYGGNGNWNTTDS